jgi:hypothetical protein
MKIRERIKSQFRRQPRTAEELDARAEAESVRAQISEDEAAVRNKLNAQFRGPR